MEKIKTFVKEINSLAIISFFFAIFALYYSFTSHECSNAPSIIGLVSFLTGIISFVRLNIRKQRGELFAIFGMLLGLLVGVLLNRC